VKRSMVILAGLATLAGAAFLTSQMLVQAQVGGGGAPASCKVGLINLAAVLKGYNKFSIYNNEIEKIRLEFEKKEKDLQNNAQLWKDYKTKQERTPAEKDQADKNITQIVRGIEANKQDYNAARTKKSDEQMVQMYKEIEAAVQKCSGPQGFQLILHYSEPLNDTDRYSPQNIQRKLVGPGSSGGVCPLYMAPGMDISQDVVNALNAMYPATPVAMPTQPAQPTTPGGQH
jgi:Skp family chaperone for outer membrane proteins